MELTVSVPQSWLMREPKKSAAKETQLLLGHKFKCEKIEKNWAYGQTLSPLGQDVKGYRGWVKRKALSENQAENTHHVHVIKAPVFHKADIKSRVTQTLCLGSQVIATRQDENFYELASGGYIHAKHLLPLGTFSTDDCVSVAEAHIGLPYIWGGVSTDGLDCSGLVQSALRAVGRDCLRDAGPQEKSLGKTLNDGAPLQRGDLIFWPGHVGIMSDEATLLHANAFHMCVATEPLAEAVARIGSPRTIRRLS